MSYYNRSFFEIQDKPKEDIIHWLKNGGIIRDWAPNRTDCLYLYWEVWQVPRARFIVDKTYRGITRWKEGFDSFDDAMYRFREELESNAVEMAKRAFGLD